MANTGGGESSHENPLPLNVVPLIDVIFCLLLFFMCSFHFKTLEGKLEAWLPQNKGENGPTPESFSFAEIRVTLRREGEHERVVRRFGRTEYADDGDLGDVIKTQFDRHKANGEGDVPVILQPDGDVPWDSVLRVMDLAHERGLPRLELALARR